jgi:hypothetical protein
MTTPQNHPHHIHHVCGYCQGLHLLTCGAMLGSRVPMQYFIGRFYMQYVIHRSHQTYAMSNDALVIL